MGQVGGAGSLGPVSLRSSPQPLAALPLPSPAVPSCGGGEVRGCLCLSGTLPLLSLVRNTEVVSSVSQICSEGLGWRILIVNNICWELARARRDSKCLTRIIWFCDNPVKEVVLPNISKSYMKMLGAESQVIC